MVELGSITCDGGMSWLLHYLSYVRLNTNGYQNH
jgi:hypothetical protein